MDEVLEYNRKTLTGVYMTEVGERTEDVENKVSFLRDQLAKNENQAILQQEVDKIKDRGRILKEQVDALVTEFETKYYELKATRTEHIQKMEAEYSSFLLKLKTESAKCEDVCKSGRLQEVEGIIKSLDELLNQTILPNIELHDDFFEPVQTAATELRDLFGKICSNAILIPDRGDELSGKAALPDVDMADDSDIASLIESEHGATPKSTSIQEDIVSEKSFIQSETGAKSYDGDFDDVVDSIRDSSMKSDKPARETASDKLSQASDKKLSAQSGSDDDVESEMISVQSEVILTSGEPVSDRETSKSGRPVKSCDEFEPEPSSKHSFEDGRKSVAKSDKSATEDFVEEDLNVTDTSQVLEKEDDRNIEQDTEDDIESEKSKCSYVTSSEEVASSKSSSLPKSKDAADIISKDVVTNDTEEHSLVGNSDRGSGTPVKDTLYQDDSKTSETGKPVNEAPVQVTVEIPLGQDSIDDQPKFKTDQGQLDHSSDTEVADGTAKGKSISKESVPATQEKMGKDREPTQDLVKIEEVQKVVSKEYPKEEDIELSKEKAEETHVQSTVSITETRDDMYVRESLRRNSVYVDNESGGGRNIPSVTAHTETHDILDILHTFKVKGGDEVISICPLTSGECAWIARQKGKHVFRAIKMVSRSGKVIQTSGFPRAVVDISVDQNDGILVTCTDSVVRQMLAVDKSVVKFETDEDLTSLCQLKSGNVVVCHYLTSKVTLVDPTGDILGCLDGKGSDRAIVGNPWKVRVNESNDNIVIINRQGPSSIVVVDKDLNFRFLFDGKKTYTAANIHDFSSSTSRETTSAEVTTSGSICDNRFIPVDACFDSSSNMLIAEYNRKAILVLDAEGRLLGTLYNECTRPTSLAVDSQGHLWVGYVNGKVDIIRHLGEKINWLK